MGIFSRLGIGTTTNRPTLAKTSRATIERIRNILGVRELESMPAQAARAFQLASDPKAKGEEFVEVIESDEALSARVIRIANSVFFFRGNAANDIDKAVANIGLDELRCLLSASMLKSLLNIKHPVREQIWSNAVATGIACRLLTRYTPKIHSGEAFLAGLLHDVGKLIMVRRGGALYEQVVAKVSAKSEDFIAAEEEIFELNHVEVGKWVGEEWNFPAAVLQAIAFHHDPWPKGDSPINFDLPYLVKLADLISHAASLGHPSHMRSLSLRAEDELNAIVERLPFNKGELKRIKEELIAQFDREMSLYQMEDGRR